jgi:hypothetical protein
MPKVDGPTVTIMTLLLALVALLGYDLFAVYRFGYEGTISLVVFTTAKAFPIIPFLAGVVVGHLFFPIEGTDVRSSGKDSGESANK